MINKIYNEDCIIGIKKIPDNYIDLVIIDPPYLINNHSTTNSNELSVEINKYNEELFKHNLTKGYDTKILDELIRVMKKINITIMQN